MCVGDGEAGAQVIKTGSDRAATIGEFISILEKRESALTGQTFAVAFAGVLGEALIFALSTPPLTLGLMLVDTRIAASAALFFIIWFAFGRFAPVQTPRFALEELTAVDRRSLGMFEQLYHTNAQAELAWLDAIVVHLEAARKSTCRAVPIVAAIVIAMTFAVALIPGDPLLALVPKALGVGVFALLTAGMLKTDVEGKAPTLFYLSTWRADIRAAASLAQQGRFILYLREFDTRTERAEAEKTTLRAGRFGEGGTERFRATGVDVALHHLGYASRCLTVRRPLQTGGASQFVFAPILSDEWQAYVGQMIAAADRIIVAFNAMGPGVEWELSEIAKQDRKPAALIVTQAPALPIFDGFCIIREKPFFDLTVRNEHSDGPDEPTLRLAGQLRAFVEGTATT